MKILFTGGGTGGHILPLVAVARELQKTAQKDQLKLFYLGPHDNFNELLLAQEGIRVKNAMAGKVRRYFGPLALLQNLLDVFFKIPFGFLQAFLKLAFIGPDLILSKGGYGALPTTLAAWVLRIPVFLHESDSIPGKANQIASMFALKIFTSFPRMLSLSPKKTILVGNPIRTALLEGSKEEAKTVFNLQEGKPVVLVLGGSQGAQKINDAVLSILNQLTENFEVIHQTGEHNFPQVFSEAKAVLTQGNEKYYHAFAFLKEPELRHAFAAADIIVARAGSGSIFEIAALGKPSILVPLSSAAQNHQARNSYEYQKSGACAVLEEANLTPHFFLEKLKYLASSPKEMQTMSQAALNFAKPEAASTIAQYLLEYLK